MAASRQPGRVRIRPLTAADEKAFLSAVARSRQLHRPWVSPPATRAAFRRLIRSDVTEAHRRFVVIDRATGEFAGAIGIGHIIRGPLNSAFVGYYAFAGFEGRGLMRDAMWQVLAQAFGRLKLHRIEANIQPGNHASRRFIRHFGFKREGYSPRYLKVRGRWRDHERWALLAEDYRAVRDGSGADKPASGSSPRT